MVASRVPTVANPPDNRSPLSAAMARVSQVTGIALEMAVPMVIGYFVDRWLGTRPVFAAIGAILGMIVGLTSLLRLGETARRDQDQTGKDGKRPPHDARGRPG